MVEPNVEAAEIAGGDGVEDDGICAVLFQGPFVVPGIDLGHPADRGAAETGAPLPVGLAPAAPILGPGPDDPDALAKLARAETAHRLQNVHAIPDLDPFDRSLGRNLDLQGNAGVGSLDDVAHHHLVDGPRTRIGERLRVLVEEPPAPRQGGAHVEMEARSGSAVVMALAQAFEDAVAGQLLRVKTGEPAIGAEHRCAGITRPGAALVAVAVADDAAAVA